MITTNTECSIAPKLHKARDAPRNKTNTLNGTASTGGKAPTNGVAASSSNTVVPVPIVKCVILRVLPSRLLPSASHPSHNGPELLAFLSPNALSELEGPKTQSATPKKFSPATFKKLRPPHDPASSSTPGPPPEASARVLNSSARNESDSKLALIKPGAGGVYVGPSEQVPSGHIVYSALPDGVEEWDLVR